MPLFVPKREYRRGDVLVVLTLQYTIVDINNKENWGQTGSNYYDYYHHLIMGEVSMTAKDLRLSTDGKPWDVDYYLLKVWKKFCIRAASYYGEEIKHPLSDFTSHEDILGFVLRPPQPHQKGKIQEYMKRVSLQLRERRRDQLETLAKTIHEAETLHD